jgi:hypothetical protein
LPLLLPELGIKYIIFDKDQTLTSTYANDFHPSISITHFKETFGESSIAILSNSVGSSDDRNYQGLLHINEIFNNNVNNHFDVLNCIGAILTESCLQLPVVRHALKKPDCLKEVGGISLILLFYPMITKH